MQTLNSSMLGGKRLTGVAQEAWQDFVQRGDTVVDATAGNGGDTVWLAKAVGPQGKVHAFDKQVQQVQLLLELKAVLTCALIHDFSGKSTCSHKSSNRG